MSRTCLGGVLALLLAVSNAKAQNYVVDQTLGDSPAFIGADLSADLLTIGSVSTGVLNQNAFTIALTFGMTLGQSAGSNGTYNLSGGTLFANGASAASVIGAFGTGVMNQTGGSVNIADELDLGYNNSGQGTYNLSGFLSVGDLLEVGFLGTGSFSQTSGIGQANRVYIGDRASGTGTFSISGGTFTATNQLIVGLFGAGTFNLEGGSVVTNLLRLSNGAGSSGTFNLDAGSITAGDVDVNYRDTTSSFNFNGGTLRAARDNTGFIEAYQKSGGVYIRDGGGVIDTNSHDVGVFADIAHSNTAGDAAKDGGLTKIGSGTLTLFGNNTFTGNVNVNAGKLALGLMGKINNAALGSNFYVDGATDDAAEANIYNTASVTTGDLRLGTTSGNQGILTIGGTATFSTKFAFVGYNGTGILNILAGSFSITDNNILNLGFNAGSTGTVNLDGGTLTTRAVSRLAGSAYFNFNGGTLRANGDNTGFFGGLTLANVRNGGARFDTNGFNVTVAQPLLHSAILGDAAIDGGLAKNGAGTLTLSGASTYNGPTALNAGALDITGAIASPSSNLTVSNGSIATLSESGSVNVNAVRLSGNDSTFNLNAGTLTTGSVQTTNGSTNFYFNGGTLRAASDNVAFLTSTTGAEVRNGGAFVDTNGHTITVSAPIVHSTVSGDATTDGGLTKSGNGTLILTGTNTYSGNTTVNGGVLRVDGSIASGGFTGQAVINNNATLAGIGSVGSSVLVNSGGRIAPGDAGAGLLSISYTVSLQSNSTLSIELGGLNAGSGYDQLAVSSLFSGASNIIAGSLQLSLIGGFSPNIGDKFFIIDSIGFAGNTGSFSNPLVDGLITDAQGNRFLINYHDTDTSNPVPLANDVSLTFLGVVPEPATNILLGCGLFALFFARMFRASRRA